MNLNARACFSGSPCLLQGQSVSPRAYLSRSRSHQNEPFRRASIRFLPIRPKISSGFSGHERRGRKKSGGYVTKAMAASGGAGSEDEDDILTGGMGFGLDISKYETVECPVPPDQRPIFEYRALKSDFSLKVPRELPVFATQLVIPAVAGLLVAGPVAGYTFPVDKHPAEFALSTMAGTLVPVAMVVLRSYLSWSYVGNRLFSATVEYEESGWWDGQTWVKPPEVLARDRLLGLYQVKPVLEMLKGTLLGLGGGIVACGVTLLAIEAIANDVRPM